MRTTAIIEGLTILEKYRDKTGGFNTNADHDVLYAHRTDRPVEAKDLARLIELGWFQDEVSCDDEKFAAKHYDPGKGWTCFT